MFNFQYSQINRQELEQLAELSVKFSMVYATSKFDGGKHIHQYNFRLNVTQFSKNTAQVKYQLTDLNHLKKKYLLTT